MGLLNKKLALVTGSARGLGASIALGLADEGAMVICCDRDVEGVGDVVKRIREKGGQADAARIDVTDRDATYAAAAEITARHGNIDILVNNAGVAGRAMMDEPAMDDVWDRVMAVNLNGTFNVVRAFVPALKSSKGVIVNIASVVAFVSGASTAGYVVSKGAIRSLTQVLARDLAEYGVRVNAVAPGIMMTEMARAQLARPNGADWFLNRVMMKRIGEVSEIVGPVVFLASEMSSFITGTVLPVDGGFLAA